MLGTVWTKIDGYKTYILSGLGIVVALVGHFAGPIYWGPIQIPMLSWNEVWDIVWKGGLFSALRQGVSKTQTPSV